MKKTIKNVVIKRQTTLKNKVVSAHNVQTSLILDKLPGYFLILCLLLVFSAFIYILSPFITVIFVGAVLAIAFNPVYQWLSVKLSGCNRLASTLTCLLTIVLIIVPTSFFIVLLANEAISTYDLVYAKINSGVFDKYLMWANGGYFYDWSQQIQPFVDLGSLGIKDSIINFAQTLSAYLVSQTTYLLKSISEIAFGVLVMFICMFYFFKDGDKIVNKISMISPLPREHEIELFSKIKSMVNAVVLGVFVTAIVQGFVGGIGFAIAGIPSPVFWGAAMAFFSLIPVVGTAIIMIPAAVIMAILGNYGGALFLFLWGIFAVGSVDNILRSYLIGGKSHTYPLLTFLVVLAGVVKMGLKGVVVGPLVLIILLSFIHIYESEYARVLK